jgi:penicillin V acylase-like amidase (Ntn superfamily)
MSMCTRVFWSNNPFAKVVDRTTDMWGASRARLVWRPVGLVRSRSDDDNALCWTSRYDTLVIHEERSLPFDCINELGLTANALMFTTAVYPEPDGPRDRLGEFRVGHLRHCG